MSRRSLKNCLRAARGACTAVIQTRVRYSGDAAIDLLISRALSKFNDGEALLREARRKALAQREDEGRSAE